MPCAKLWQDSAAPSVGYRTGGAVSAAPAAAGNAAARPAPKFGAPPQSVRRAPSATQRKVSETLDARLRRRRRGGGGRRTSRMLRHCPWRRRGYGRRGRQGRICAEISAPRVSRRSPGSAGSEEGARRVVVRTRRGGVHECAGAGGESRTSRIWRRLRRGRV